jgi:hypothetical protein
MKFILMFALLFVLTGCDNPEMEARFKQNEEAAAMPARFEFISSEVVVDQYLRVVKDKKTGIEYVISRTGVLSPLLPKKEER